MYFINEEIIKTCNIGVKIIDIFLVVMALNYFIVVIILLLKIELFIHSFWRLIELYNKLFSSSIFFGNNNRL